MIFAVHDGHLFFCEKHKYPGQVSGYVSEDTQVCESYAARMSDMCDCGVAGFHRTPICEGAATVFVNSLPFARLLVPTMDPGMVIQGEPSVIVGGPTFSVADIITIQGDPEYQAKVLRDLGIISSTKSGQRLFASMRESGKRCIIRPCDDDCCSIARAHPDPYAPDDMHNGKGSDTEVCYDPDKTRKTGYKPDAAPWNFPPNYSADVTLFHELVHADDAGHGRLDKTSCRNTGGPGTGVKEFGEEPCGELRAVGLGPYADHDEFYSENSYREERGYRRADWY